MTISTVSLPARPGSAPPSTNEPWAIRSALAAPLQAAQSLLSERPIAALFVAAGLGALLGWIVKR